MRGLWLGLAMMGVGTWGLVIFFWQGYVFTVLTLAGAYIVSHHLRESEPDPADEDDPIPPMRVRRRSELVVDPATGRTRRRRLWW